MSDGIICGDVLQILGGMADASVDLVFGSPPYVGQRQYREPCEANHPDALPDGKGGWYRLMGIARDFEPWVTWMLMVTSEAVRVSRGLTIWVIGCPVEDGEYQPIAEALMVDWRRMGAASSAGLFGADGTIKRPLYWHRAGTPGNQTWCRNVIEQCVCFSLRGRDLWTDPYADGTPTKPGAGRNYSARGKSGQRQKSRSDPKPLSIQTNYLEVIDPEEQVPEERSPNLISVHAGGGHMGHPLATLNEAPFPVELAKRVIPRACPPGGTVLDPFAGGGTTGQAARELGRTFILSDLRLSQCELMQRRLA